MGETVLNSGWAEVEYWAPYSATLPSCRILGISNRLRMEKAGTPYLNLKSGFGNHLHSLSHSPAPSVNQYTPKESVKIQCSNQWVLFS